ncbi:MAG: hypothetical protein LBE81_00405 [Azonexus sp.]|jgi:hypothetical protein|uniref:hypothetical protein n=1 Tax=Azonexus sp. TaxID=1872668 RepID=UPI0028267AC6|nr:hypothetical protein [Azonexus sp.]MDR0775090.1 hypothetical protein [Azonexus sp.]
MQKTLSGTASVKTGILRPNGPLDRIDRKTMQKARSRPFDLAFGSYPQAAGTGALLTWQRFLLDHLPACYGGKA